MKNAKKMLDDSNIKTTKQREIIFSIILNAKDHPDAKEIFHRAQKFDNSIGIATVYRAIALFEQEGLLNRIDFDQGKKARFEAKDHKNHHHHIIDINNGDIIEFSSDEFEKIKDKIAKQYGYKVICHKFELYCVKAEN